MISYIPNTNSNLKVARRASDGKVLLIPIVYWVELRGQRLPIDLTNMAMDYWALKDADFAVHDGSNGHVFLRDGSVFKTLEAFNEASR